MTVAEIGTASFGFTGFGPSFTSVSATRTLTAGSRLCVTVFFAQTGVTFGACTGASFSTGINRLESSGEGYTLCQYYSTVASTAGSATIQVTTPTNTFGMGICVQEVSGADFAVTPVFGGALQEPGNAATDGISSGSLTLAAASLLMALSIHSGPNASPNAPAPGTGFSASGTGWFGGVADEGCAESKRVTSSAAATFTAPGTEDIGTVAMAFAEAGSASTTINGARPQPAIPYGYTTAKGATIAPAVTTSPQKIYGSQPQAPSAFFGASLVIAGLLPSAIKAPTIYGSALKQTSDYGATRVITAPIVPATPALQKIYGSALKPTSDYGSANVVVARAPVASAAPTIKGSSPRYEDFSPYYASTQINPGAVYANMPPPQQIISAPLPPNDYGTTRIVVGLSQPASAPQTIYGSAPKPTSDYGSARAISVLAPATQPPTPQTIYGSEPQITSDYGTTRIIAGSVPLAVLLPTIYGPDASQPTDYGYARAIKGLVPAPSVLPPTIYHAQLEQPSAFIGLATVVKGLAPAAQGAPPKVVSSTPQPPMLYGWSIYVKGTPAVIVPFQTIYGSRANVSQDYGSARFIAGLVPAPIAAQTIFGPDALPVEAYGSARVIVGLVPTAVLPPTIYGSAPRPLHIDGLSRSVVGLIPAPLQFQRVYGATPLQIAEYGSARFVRGLIPVIAVLPPTIYGSAPEQVSYYGGVVVVPGLVPKHGAAGSAVATDEQIAFALAWDTEDQP